MPHSMPSRAAVARRHELEIRARYRNLWKQVPSYPWPRGAVRILHVKAKTELPGMTIENGIDSRKLCKNHEESRARAYLDGIWQDQANLAKYPGLRDSLEKRSQYYRSKGQPEPQFLEPLETRRCIYGIVDLHKGIVRVGAAGRVTKLDNPGRPLIARIGEHFYAGKKLQDYWLSRRAAVPQEIVEPTENHRYPLACFIAYYGKLRWAVMPLCHVPMPDPLVLETKGEWELAHAPYEADWIAYLRTELPWGLNKMRATERAKQQRASKSPYFAEWLMKFQGHKKFYDDMRAHSRLVRAQGAPGTFRNKKGLFELAAGRSLPERFRWQKLTFHQKYDNFEKKFSKIDKKFVS